MADPKIKLKRSAVSGKIPTADQLPLGEVALNTYDGKLYASKNIGIGTTVFSVNPWSVGLGTNTYSTYFTAGDVGIGTSIPRADLHVVGIVSATSFIGDASGLTNIPAGARGAQGTTGSQGSVGTQGASGSAVYQRHDMG